MRRKFAALLLAVVMLFGVTGCGEIFGLSKNKISISIYLWDKSMSKELTPWLEKQFPDISFTFVVGYNTMDFYTDLNNRDSLPDIITCRRFSLNDAAHMSDLLMDMSQTEIVGSFYDSYIENPTQSHYCWDAITAGIFLCPDLITETENRDLAIDCNSSGYSYANAATWATGKGPYKSKNVQIVFNIDRDEFWTFVTDLYGTQF